MLNIYREMTKKNRHPQGFTLIELLVVVAVMALAASLAAPNMASLVRANRAAGEITALSSSIRAAKSEAIKRGGGCATVLILKWNLLSQQQ